MKLCFLAVCSFLAYRSLANDDVDTSTFSAGSGSATYTTTSSIGLDSIVVVVRTQANSVHRERAEAQKIDWQKQFAVLKANPEVFRLHETEAPEGAWTIFPIIEKLSSKYPNAKWYIFCEDQTVIDFAKLLQVLGRYSQHESAFLGRGLFDREPSIIHHYAFYENIKQSIYYPDFAAGWALNRKLITRLADRLKANPRRTDFSIDVQHELAMFIYDEGKGQRLTNVDELCAGVDKDSAQGKKCATNFPSSLGDCEKVELDDIFFAVKTTEQYHQSRLSVIKRTWGNVKGIIVKYFSNVTDPTIPTEDTGVPNVPTGHCAKSYAILKKAATDPNYKKIKWTLLVDDDTLISVSRLQRLLACYDPNEVVFLGEVYGYGQSAGHGYPYITLGGGMAVSKAALAAWQQVAEKCRCPAIDTPDDMWIGQCLHQSRHSLTHRPEFHQAKASEYSLGYLARQTPVTFHKLDFVNVDQLYENELRDL